jgi:phosphohistidine phosphatase
MKTVYLIRHAKSSWDDEDLDDFDRPLNDRGLKDAPRMGKRLQDRVVVPDIIYASPALRALTTAQIIAEIIGYPVKAIQTDRRMYNADEDVLLEILQSVLDKNNCIFMVSHNPGITAFANALFNQSIENIPTTGIVAGELNINSWRSAKWGVGKQLIFDFPKA